MEEADWLWRPLKGNTQRNRRGRLNHVKALPEEVTWTCGGIELGERTRFALNSVLTPFWDVFLNQLLGFATREAENL